LLNTGFMQVSSLSLKSQEFILKNKATVLKTYLT
jgi:hypothetical protein